jgi:hypothetical protein
MGIIASLFRWPSLGTHTAFMCLAFAVFGVPGVAMWWMIYDAIRYERRPWPYVLLSFVPYWFVWHYFQRVRKRGRAERQPVAFH